MTSVGIISEYNPFHAGHAYHLACARRDTGAELTVAVMSEHATQRGELALADGYVRAEAAVRAGVDLVIGLPFPYSCAPAEFFALAGIRILDALGVEAVHFGSECGDMEALKQTSATLYSPAFIERLTQYQQQHPTHGVMECRDAVYQQMHGKPPVTGSNDLLGMAYVHALTTCQSAMRPYTTRRHGQDYNDTQAPNADRYPSAAALRRQINERGLASVTAAQHLPPASAKQLTIAARDGLLPLLPERIDSVLLTFYRLVSPDTLARCAGMSGGLGERLCRVASQVTSVPQLLERAATKRYTDGRIRRALLFGFCGVTDEHLSAPPAYVRLLGANARGCAYLSCIRKTCSLPILTKPSDLPLTPEAQRQREVECRLEALVSLALPTPHDTGFWLRRTPVIDI